MRDILDWDHVGPVCWTHWVELEENCSNDIFGTNSRIFIVHLYPIVSVDDVLEGEFGPLFPPQLWKDWVEMTLFELNKEIVTEFPR